MLTVRNVITTVQQALVEQVDLALGRRYEVEDLAALRLYLTGAAGGTKNLADRALCHVHAAGCYRFDLYCTLPDDGALVIRPADRGSKAGRWRRCEMTAPYGRFRLPLRDVPARFLPREPAAGQLRYLRAVEIYEGAADEEEALERIAGAPKPAVLFKWEEDDPHPRTNRPGCMYFGPQVFTALVVAQHNRQDASALQGSPLPAEQDRDGPGLNRMIGDLRYVLAGAQLGLGPWVERVELGPARILVEDLAQRFFMAAVGITVFCSYHLPEEELEPIDIVAVQPALATAPPGLFPADNFVRGGFAIALGPGLTQTPEPGMAIVGGQVVRSTPPALTFAASRDTYLDLRSDGVLVQSAVAPAAQPPPLAGALRIALVSTDASNITYFAYLCPALLNWRGPYFV